MSIYHGSCLICGYDKPFKAWVANKEGEPVAGICEECLNHARDYPQLEAQAAVMRKALEQILDSSYNVRREGRILSAIINCDKWEAAQQALSTDAGRELLERMRKLEVAVKEAKTIAKWMKWWLDEDLCDCDTYHVCGRPQRERELQNFEQAIADLEKGGCD